MLARRRAHRHERLEPDRRPLRAHARPRHQLRDRALTGEIIRVGDGGGKKIRKSSSGYQLKHLFMGHQGTLGIVTEATLELVPRPESEFAAFFLPVVSGRLATGGVRAVGPRHLAGVVLDEWKLDYLRRDDEAWIPAPDWVKSIVAVAMYGQKDEVRAGAKQIMRIAKANGSTYAGDEISHGDWASRHDRYATPQHGRTRDGQVALMSWHCEDAAINYSQLPAVRGSGTGSSTACASASTRSTTGACSRTRTARSGPAATT